MHPLHELHFTFTPLCSCDFPLCPPPPPPTIQAIIAQSPIANLKHQYRTQFYLINLILIQPKIATTLNDRLKLQPKPS